MFMKANPTNKSATGSTTTALHNIAQPCSATHCQSEAWIKEGARGKGLYSAAIIKCRKNPQCASPIKANLAPEDSSMLEVRLQNNFSI